MRRSLATVTTPDGLTLATETTSWGGALQVDVVATHATGFCKEVFRPVVAELATIVGSGSVLALDQRGHGASDRPPLPIDWWDMGGDVGAVVGQSAPDRPVAVAHSGGGAAAVMAELTEPGTFSALVLVEPIITPPPNRRVEESSLVDAAMKRKRVFESPEAAAENFREKPTFALWHPAALAAYVEYGLRPAPDGWVLACDPEVEAECYRGGYAHDTWTRLAELSLPVTLVAGEHSPTHSGPGLDLLAAQFPGAELVVVPGASHFVVMERPDVIAALAAARLAGRSPAAGLR